jgi:predicted metal-binding transcription factor (methanogenesis marker protein 9)
MSKPMVRIVELDGTVIDREMTNAEFVQYEKDVAENLAYKAELQSQATAKAELLERLGITADEAKLLLA